MNDSNSEIEFNWADSNSYYKDSEGKLVRCGTVIQLINQFLFLESLSEDNLLKLKKTVNSAVEYELNRRIK